MKKKYRLRGSYTVEAALVFPFILSVIVLILYFSFYIHDRSILNHAAYVAALRGSQINGTQDIFAKVDQYSKDLIENRLLGTKQIERSVKITKDKILVTYEGKMQIPAGSILTRALRRDVFKIKVEGFAKRMDTVTFIRECKVVENIVKREKQK